jgi:hypothetical protein
MPRLASITSQALTGIARITETTAQAAYSIVLSATDNVNSTGNTLYNGETATFTITAVDDTITDPGSFVTPTLYWSIGATTSEFTSVSGSINLASNSHDGDTTMTSTYSLDIVTASSIVSEGSQTLVLREGAVDGPVAATYTVSIENFVPPPGNWTDDNGDPVTVASIVSPIAMQVNGVFAVNPGVPFTIQGAITGAETTIINIAANTGTLLEIDDSGNSNAFQIGEQLDIVAAGSIINLVDSETASLDPRYWSIDNEIRLFGQSTLRVDRTSVNDLQPAGVAVLELTSLAGTLSNPFTLEFWIRDTFDVFSTNGANILELRGAADRSGKDMSFYFTGGSPRQAAGVTLEDTDLGTGYQETTIEGFDQAIDPTDWTHIAFVAENDYQMQIYVDGQKLNELTSINPNRATLNQLDWLGRDSNDNTFIDGFRYIAIGRLVRPQFNIAEIRLSDNARYTTSFSRPAAAFTEDANTIALIRPDI